MLQLASPKLLLWLDQVGSNEYSTLGGKAANLSRLKQLGIPVPPAFGTTACAYDFFMDHAGIRQDIERITSNVDYNSAHSVQQASSEIRKLFGSATLPGSLVTALESAYSRLCSPFGTSELGVAIRSSANVEDSEGASFAGQYETFLNVKGKENVVSACKDCMASLFTSRAITYRHERHFGGKAAMSVIVQVMVDARVAGAMFTTDPATGRKDVIVIEGSWGLGESVVAGTVTPDHFEVEKSDLTIVGRKLSTKRQQVVQNAVGTGVTRREVPGDLRMIPCLTDSQVTELARYAIIIEKHFGMPQDIEWAIDSSQRTNILQTRPVTGRARFPKGISS